MRKLKRYMVPITRDVEGTETTYVDVTAASVKAAMKKALAEATAHEDRFNWAPDDGSGMCDAEPYIAVDSGADVYKINDKGVPVQ